MEKAIYPEKLVNWFDIARGAGEVAVQTIVRFVRHVNTEPRPSHSEHYRGPVVEAPQPYEQLTLPKADPVVPDVMGRDLPPFDSEGRYLKAEDF